MRSIILILLLGLSTTNASTRRVGETRSQLKVQAPGYAPTQDNAYIGVSIKATPGYIIKFEPFAHADRIHHILLYGCDKPAFDTPYWESGATCAGASHILYAWARNAPSLTLPEDVGFAVGNPGDPVQYIVLQVHYAHPFDGNVRDFCGVIMHMTNIRPANLAAVYLFVSGDAIPPRQAVALNNISCTYEGDADLHPFAFRTHTHTMGRVVSAFYKRDGHWNIIGKRNPQWPQLFQKIGKDMTIKKGDFMAATCRFDAHDRNEYTSMGSMGLDEMCNFYMMFYRAANATDPFPWGAGCGGNENPSLVASEYPKEGVELLPAHPEWEHAAHQAAKPFGIKQRFRVGSVEEHKLGQISGVAFDKTGDLFIFHRGDRYWSQNTFDYENKLSDRTPISQNVIIKARPSQNSLTYIDSFGKNLFYMPHGIFVDESHYIYTTDVGSHQVIKWSAKKGKLEQVWALGEKFEPGSDKSHFCKPAGVAVSRDDGTVYVADGYCNNRVMVFDKNGKFIQQFGKASSPHGREGGAPPLGSFFLPHDISLDEKHHRVYVADRENGRVQIFNREGDAEKEVSFPTLFRDVYSAHYTDERGLLLIPGTALSTSTQIEAFICPATSFEIQVAFRPLQDAFQRPHIIRGHGDNIVVGEIAESGGVITFFDVSSQAHAPHVSSAELYTSPDVAEAGSPWLVSVLVAASILIALFVAYMRYRDVTDSNIIDRTGFKPLRTDDVPSDDDDDVEEFVKNRP